MNNNILITRDNITFITFLMELHEKFNINIKKKCYFHKMFRLEHDYIKNFIFELDYFYDFVTSLDSNTLYSVIPMIITNNELNKPYMVLSRTILVTKYSNYKEIHHYTFAKYQEALKDFNIDKYSNFHCCF